MHYYNQQSLLFISISYVLEKFNFNKVMDKSVSLYWWFSFDLSHLVLGGANNVLHSSVKKGLHFVEPGTSEKVLQ